MFWVLGVVAIGVSVQAGKMSLQWGQSADPKVTGYRVRLTQTSTGATSVVEVGNTNVATVINLIDGQSYQVAVIAVTVEGIESDPSNSVSYTVPYTGPTYALQFGKFSHGTAQYAPHGVFMASGDNYPPGTVVTLTATTVSGYVCTGWTINSVFYSGNPRSITMNANQIVMPVIAKINGSVAAADPSLAFLKISAGAGTTSIGIGGEFGAWTMEGTDDFKTWTQVATGLTSDQVTLQTPKGNRFYRVRSIQLTAFQTR